ncbi:MAG: hypothetical protein IKD16_02515, partial [Bacteroidales bacterium]|nr:hypothetical protein [Bacteroidales bacterium]
MMLKRNLSGIVLRTLFVAMAFVFAFSASNSSYAQDFEQPVSWSASQSAVGEDIYEIKLAASMEGSWHIYDFGPYDGGPTPTALKISGEGIELVG